MPSPMSVRPLAFALFSYGFRPFFLGCGTLAVLALGGWIAVLAHGDWPGTGIDPLSWHTHEMLVGFLSAAIAGFLLTAVPNWTGRRGYAGGPLAALFAVWLAGRLALAPGVGAPVWLAATLDVAFYPALMALVLPSIVKAGNRRNYLFIALLGLLTVGNAGFHLDRLDWLPGAWGWGSMLTLDVILLMVALIGGRIVPSFTSSTLKRLGRPADFAQRPWLDRAALGLLILMAGTDLAAPDGVIAGTVALAAAVAHAIRLSGWHGLKAGSDPLLWVLHLAYAWIPVGLALKAGWLLGDLAIGEAWLHALTIGAFGTMILGVMARASLGHTGRALVAPRPMALAFVLPSVAALLRLAAPLAPNDPATLFAASGAAWMVAFGLFVVLYGPILVRPRVDGRPG